MASDAPPPRRATLLQRIAAVSRLGLFSGGALLHILQKLAVLTYGAAYVSEPGRRLRLAFDRSDPLPPIRTAIVAHAYYPQLICEILRCRDFLPADTALFITVPPERVASARTILVGVPAVTLIEAPNRGRDIGPFVAVLSSGVLDGFDAVLKIHTKRSPHLLDGEVRRKLLFDKLCGSRNVVRRVLESFADPSTGIVGWRASFRTAKPYWMDNRSRVEALVRQLGVPGPPPLGFFEGSMFWFRPAALSALKCLNLQPNSFEAEAGQVDGTLHHAVERLFTIAAWSSGREVLTLNRKRLTGKVS